MDSELTIIGYYLTALAGAALVVAGTIWLIGRNKPLSGALVLLLVGGSSLAIKLLAISAVVTREVEGIISPITVSILCLAIAMGKMSSEKPRLGIKKSFMALAIAFSLFAVNELILYWR